MAKKSTKLRPVKKEKKGVSYYKQPGGMSLEQWQIALRRQFVVDKPFGIEKLDGFHPVFGDYHVSNFETRNNYKVSIRDNKSSMNFCSCLDFKTNRLGTCKHIEAVLLQINNNPKLSKYLQKEFDSPYSSVYLSYKEERKVKIRVGTDYAKEFSLFINDFFDSNDDLKQEAYANFENFLEKAYVVDPDFRCYDDAMAYILEIREHNQRKSKLEKLYSENTQLNGLLKTDFFSYQNEGVLFAAKAGRSLIADEMGLGKTIQAIGAAELLKKENGISGALIICPTSLKYQWQSEIERFTDSTVRVIEGLPHIRAAQYFGGRIL
ncbi:MAG: SNF2-related protein [Paludibacteraceae bacterium]